MIAGRTLAAMQANSTVIPGRAHPCACEPGNPEEVHYFRIPASRYARPGMTWKLRSYSSYDEAATGDRREKKPEETECA
jgi:hypothetical protein